VPTRHPLLSELLTACAVVIAVWVVRDALAARRLQSARPDDDALAGPTLRTG
jgi:hypothetical protein